MPCKPRILEIVGEMMAMRESTQSNWQGEQLRDEPLARYTSWRVGGPADYFYRPVDAADLQIYMQSLDEHAQVFWMGLGSNILVLDGGIRGHVVYTRGRLSTMELQQTDLLFVEAGVPCAHVARFTTENNLGGAEFLAGIPGTMGGALAMNAGAFGGETWPLVERVLMMNRQGEMVERQADEFQYGYRQVDRPADEWFIGGWLRIPVGVSDSGKAKIKSLLARRNETQPTNMPSGGSVFKNPEGDHAARLIETCGLKGLREGGAEVSTKHANFIVNLGDARAADIRCLIERVQAEVKSQQGVCLETEVRYVGVAS